MVREAYSLRFPPHREGSLPTILVGFRLGSSGVPQGFRGGLSGFRLMAVPFFTGVPLSETPPFIILITANVWERGRSANVWERGRFGVLEFYRPVF